MTGLRRRGEERGEARRGAGRWRRICEPTSTVDSEVPVVWLHRSVLADSRASGQTGLCSRVEVHQRCARSSLRAVLQQSSRAAERSGNDNDNNEQGAQTRHWLVDASAHAENTALEESPGEALSFFSPRITHSLCLISLKIRAPSVLFVIITSWHLWL